MATRYFASFGLGVVITLILFFVMQAVIATDEARLDEGAKGKLLDFAYSMLQRFHTYEDSQTS